MRVILKNKKRNNNKIQFCIIVVFAFFTCTSVYSQNSNLDVSPDGVSIDTNDNTDNSAPERVSNSGLNSNMSFILWFMGTKGNVNEAMSNDSFYSKKNILISGREPNHLLMKTLLKKAINNKSC